MYSFHKVDALYYNNLSNYDMNFLEVIMYTIYLKICHLGYPITLFK